MKTKKEIEAEIAKLEADKRYEADVDSIVWLAIHSWHEALLWVLEKKPAKRPRRDIVKNLK